MNNFSSRFGSFESFEDASQSTLSFLQDTVGFRLWLMTKKEGDQWIVLHSKNRGYPWPKNSFFRWSDTLCSRMVSGEGPRVAPSIAFEPAYSDVLIAKKLPIRAYVGVPVHREDGSLFGTLCAFDPEPQPKSIGDQLPLIELLARMLATSLNADQKVIDQAKIAYQALVAEKALEEERWRLKSILRGTNAGTWEWNVQTGEAVFNRQWAEMLGYTLEELAPITIDTWNGLAHPEDRIRSDQVLQKHFEGETESYELECRMKHKGGHWIWILDRGRVFSWTVEGKPLLMFGTHLEITDRKRAETALRESEERYQALAKTDGLTGLLNRRGWKECLESEQERAERLDHELCIIVVDLDYLKVTNDRWGHQAGDELICRAARCIQRAVRNIDKVARTGGDEFAVLGVECDRMGAEAIMKRIQAGLAKEEISASWGLAMRRPDTSIETAMIEADRKMYEMKAKRHEQSDSQAVKTSSRS